MIPEDSNPEAPAHQPDSHYQVAEQAAMVSRPGRQRLLSTLKHAPSYTASCPLRLEEFTEALFGSCAPECERPAQTQRDQGHRIWFRDQRVGAGTANDAGDVRVLEARAVLETDVGDVREREIGGQSIQGEDDRIIDKLSMP